MLLGWLNWITVIGGGIERNVYHFDYMSNKDQKIVL